MMNAADGLMVVDHSGKIAYCNGSAGQLFGRAPDDLVGTDFGFPFSAGEEWTSLEMARDGQPHYVDMRTKPISWQGEDATLATLRDVTSRHRTEDVLEMQLAALDAAANGIYITDARGNITWVNSALTEISGYDETDLVGCNASIFRPTDHDPALYSAL